MSKTSEIGWMYYTPNKREDKEAKEYPAASQIPGLGLQQEQPTEERKIWIKDTDSSYIKLAKQGGRSDLLQFRENNPRQEAKDYPRCEWFYQEDNREDKNEANEEPYVFCLPEYMVQKVPQQQDCQPATSGEYPRGRLPYATDSYERELSYIDKQKAIPNPRKFGYGVRQERDLTSKKPTKETISAPQRNTKEPSGPDFTNKDKITSMNKLMSGTYEKDWYENRDVSEKKQKGSTGPSYCPKLVTEYQERFQRAANNEKAKRSTKKTDRRPVVQDDEETSKDIEKEIQKMEREVFKLSRFKNVNAKVESHRHGSASRREKSMYEPSCDDAPKRVEIVACT